MFKKVALSFLLIAVLLIGNAGAAFADEVGPVEPLIPPPSGETGEMVDETPSLWFVELSSAPTADGTSKATVLAEQKAFRTKAKKAGLVYTERYAFSTLFNGFSVSIPASELGKLARIPGVKNIYPVETIAMPEPVEGVDPELFTALAMTGADIAQSELGYTGKGIKVAVVDTGLDVNHPDLGGNGVAELNSSFFYSNPRVKYGYDFVGDAFNADSTSPLYNPNVTPDPIPDDCAGHGTHVSGIIGANGTVKGVAPEVTFGAYRVFGCAGSTTGDIMIAAMEKALADGMQVLNMSIGSAYQWPQYPTAMAATRLVNKGVVVVASIGNNGTNGLYAAGAPGLGEKVIGVASYDNSHVMLATFTVTPAGIIAGYGNATAAPPAPTSGSLPLTKTGTPTTADDACIAAGPLPDLTGQAVLIRRGTCGFYEKARRAELAGASAVILYNNLAGRFNPTVAVSTGAADGLPVTIPVVAISDTEGVAINNAIVSGSQTLNWTDQTASFPSPTGGLISSFSSYGLSPDLALKPDIGAPGGNIYSSYPLELGGYATLSGTSMASPHVAGAVALLLQAEPKTPAQAVRGILQNSADPKNWWGNPGLGYPDMVHRQGAGMLDIDDAILATTKVEPAKIAAGESQMGPYMQTLTIENNGAMDVTYNLSHKPALSSGPNTYTVSATTGFASVTFSTPSVTVPAGGSASVTVTITANPGLPDLSQYGGYIVFTPQGGGQIYRIPYAGLKGDYQTKQVLTSGGYGMPWLAYLDGGYYNLLTDPTDWIFAMQGGDIPYFLVHLDHQSRLFRMEIFAQNGKAWHRAYNEEYMPRNSSSTGFYAFPFDGTTFAGNKLYTVPDGTYYAVISVLKANGDSNNPAHWETWISPNFVIDRP